MPTFNYCKQALFCSGVLVFFGAAHVPGPGAHTAPPAGHASTAAMTFNQHLHITPPAPPAKATTAAPHAPALAATTRPGAAETTHPLPHLLMTHTFSGGIGWDSHAFIALHRGLATIEGEVRTAAGQPAGGARVALRKPKGRIFANVSLRHVTYTGANGTFRMADVRPGTYRVLATENKKKGFVRETVHADGMTTVAIKL